jgi:uncharacterized protein YndB with AHSA1/START domain
MTEQTVMGERTIVIERVFDAPRSLVWKMWTDPNEVARWWGPECFATPRETIEFDLRPGGVRRLTMVGPDGEEFASDGRFGVVEPPTRLSFAEEITDSPLIESAEATIEFVELDEHRTKVLVTSRMICLDELLAMAESGWVTQLDKLEPLLAGRDPHPGA